MKTSLKKFAPYGLYLALLAAVVAGGLYIVRRAFDLPLQISLGLIVVGLALYALLDPQRLRQNLTGRQARRGGNALILAIAFTGILVVANVLVNKNSPRWDITEDKTNTLAQESIDVLASLKAPVKAEAYYSSRAPTTSALELLEKIKNASDGKFDYEFIDPEADPVRAQNANITRDATIVLVQGDRSEPISFASEAEMMNALVRIDNPGERAVYFLAGHGEYEIEGSTDQAYASVKRTLEGKNYTVNTLNLLAERQIPADALAVIIPGPTQPLAQEEVDLLKGYLAQGGALVLLSEPTFVTEFGDQPDPLGAFLLSDWGVQLSNDIVIDTNINPPSVVAAAAYGQHEITDKMQNEAVIFPTTRSVQMSAESAAGATGTVLVVTSQNSWAETSQEEISSNQVGFSQDADLAGPVSIAVAAENSSTGARIVVVGDSDFASDAYASQYGNETFLINIIDWAAGQENLINLTARETTERVVVLRDQTQMGLILLFAVILPPAAVVVGGIVVWLKRRRKG